MDMNDELLQQLLSKYTPEQLGLKVYNILVERKQQKVITVHAESPTHARKLIKSHAESGGLSDEGWTPDSLYFRVLQVREGDGM